jgi:uncharacterized membrane protein
MKITGETPIREKKRSHFICTTVIGGFIFLVPVVVLAVVVVKAMDFMMVVAQPMAGWLPIDTISGVALANVLAILALIVVCFLAGLLARQALASAFVAKMIIEASENFGHGMGAVLAARKSSS